MEFNHYQEEARKTAIFPTDNSIQYLALALCGESGEIAEHIKKILRDQQGIFTDFNKTAIALELGDCLWYIANFAQVLGYSLEDIAKLNLEKIQRRQKNGTIHGSGDDR